MLQFTGGCVAPTCCNGFRLILSKHLIVKDLIQHTHTLFDERPPPLPSPEVEETSSTVTSSSLSLSSGSPRSSAEVQAMSSTTRHDLDLGGDIPASTQSLLSDAAMESRTTPSQTPLPSPLLGFPSSTTHKEGEEMTVQEPIVLEERDTKAVETLQNSTPAEPEVSAQVAPMSVAEWRLQVPSPLSPQPEALTIPQSPSESELSSTSDFPFSSATSLQTQMEMFSP